MSTRRKSAALSRTVLLVCGALTLCLAVMAGTGTAQEGFSDVPESHRFYSEIMDFYNRIIVSAFPDGTFRSDANLTRAPFAKMIVLTTDKHTAAVDNPESATLTDVTPAMGTPFPYD